MTIPLITAPAEGLPTVVDTPDGLEAAAVCLSKGTGAIAVDVERASGIRYGNRPFLFQFRREDAGTLLVDAEAFDSLGALVPVLHSAEWVLQAAREDLDNLALKGATPHRLFDTALAGKILNYEKANLAYLVERHLGVRLAKNHGREDWSQRPLPEDWLNYAALDVEFLLPLRFQLEEALHEAGKWEIASQEFAYLATWQKPEKSEPWRKLAGADRHRRHLEKLRALWYARDGC